MKIKFKKEFKTNDVLRFVAFIVGIASFIYGMSTQDIKGGLMGLVASLTIMNTMDIKNIEEKKENDK